MPEHAMSQVPRAHYDGALGIMPAAGRAASPIDAGHGNEAISTR